MLSVKDTIEMRRSIRRFRPNDAPYELIEHCASPKSIVRDIEVIIDQTTTHYILPVLPENSSKDRHSSSSAASIYAQRLTLKEIQ